MRWFKNLKKWQKGGLIGCAVGLVLASIIILSPHENPLGEWIRDCHFMCYILPGILSMIVYGDIGGAVAEYGGAVSIVIFYAVLGAIFGRLQQIDDHTQRWVYTGLLSLCLLLFYVMGSYMLLI